MIRITQIPSHQIATNCNTRQVARNRIGMTPLMTREYRIPILIMRQNWLVHQVLTAFVTGHVNNQGLIVEIIAIWEPLIISLNKIF